MITIIIIITIILNLFLPIYYMADFWYIQVSTSDQSDLPEHFMN